MITSGNAALGPNQTTGVDLVVMDDFIFGEPTAATPEPGSMLLTSMGVVALLVGRARRNRG